MAKAPEMILYSTTHLPETDNLYYKDHNLLDFEGQVVDVFANVLDKNRRNILILNQSAIYPTSGGQIHDTGVLTLLGEEYKIVNAEKVGKVVLHILDKDLPETDLVKGQTVHVSIDKARRS